MKKGVTIQPFLFIMALVVMAFVITFGTKSFFDLQKSADFTEVGVFIDKLDDEAEKFYNFEVGSSNDAGFHLPMRVAMVCFANHGGALRKPVPDPLLREALGSGIRSNVFVLPFNVLPKTDFLVEHLAVKEEENPLCILTKGKLDVMLETVLREGQVQVEISQR